MPTFTDGYLKAINDVEQLLRNADENNNTTCATWHWGFELQDQLIMLKEEVKNNGA